MAKITQNFNNTKFWTSYLAEDVAEKERAFDSWNKQKGKERCCYGNRNRETWLKRDAPFQDILYTIYDTSSKKYTKFWRKWALITKALILWKSAQCVYLLLHSSLIYVASLAFIRDSQYYANKPMLLRLFPQPLCGELILNKCWYQWDLIC